MSHFDGNRIRLAHKKEKPPKLRIRHSELGIDGIEFFTALASDRAGTELLFADAGRPWTRRRWAEEVRAAVTKHNEKAHGRSRLPDGIGAYAFRHARISGLLQKHEKADNFTSVQINFSDKRTDTLRLRFLSAALREPEMTMLQGERLVLADSLDRYLAGYPKIEHRRSEKERTHWHAVGYEIRVKQSQAKGKMRNLKELASKLSEEYAAKLGIKLGAARIRKLRSEYPDAIDDAQSLIDEARDCFATGFHPTDPSTQTSDPSTLKGFTDLYEAAFSQACWYAQIAAAAIAADAKKD